MKKRVILCSVDGMRPDAVQAASTPTMDRLVRGGAHTWTARTVMPSSTLPCHTSVRLEIYEQKKLWNALRNVRARE